MAVMDSVRNSTQTTEDELSPTTLILNSLKRQGVPITPDNIRRAVSANARESGQAGADPIAGLRNAGVEDNSPSVGRRGNVATKIEDVTNRSPQASTGPVDRRPAGETSTPPSNAPNISVNSGMQDYDPGNVGKMVLGGAIPAAMFGSNALGAYGSGGRPDTNPYPPVDSGALNGPGEKIFPSQETSMEPAMQRAMAPAGESLIPGVNAFLPEAASGMPVGPSTVDPAVLNEANIRGGLTPAPNVPFTPRAGGMPRVPPSITNPGSGDLMAQIARLLGGRH